MSINIHAMKHYSEPNLNAPPPVKESSLELVAKTLQSGCVYRREDLVQVSNAVDRHLGMLVKAGLLQKLAQGLYYAPKKSAFGIVPPADQALVKKFLNDQDFLVFSPSSYNTLGFGTTQLYNKTIVYNHKRHGLFSFGNREFDFRVKPRFPKRLTPEFLMVDALNNIDSLAEDKDSLLKRVEQKLVDYDQVKLCRAIEDFGSVATRKRFKRWLNA